VSLIVWLVVAAIVVDFLPWIVGGLMLWAAVFVVRSMLASAAAQRQLERQRQAVIAARADRQHAAVLAGDERGVYGDYPPVPLEHHF
jgi:hypothetical protein